MWNLELYPIRLSKLSNVVMLGLTLEATQFSVNPKTGLMSIILCHPFCVFKTSYHMVSPCAYWNTRFLGFLFSIMFTCWMVFLNAYAHLCSWDMSRCLRQIKCSPEILSFLDMWGYQITTQVSLFKIPEEKVTNMLNTIVSYTKIATKIINSV